ncbi:MAG: EAL domain-containing protein [Methylococcaceae bacterium]|nr:EAL domain-containing protein [Methylococcaceae bacterium]
MKSIASKFNLLTNFLIILTAILVGGYLIWLHQWATFRNFSQHGKEIAIMLAKNIEYGVFAENRKEIEHSLQGLEQNPDIAYLMIYNKRLQKLAEKNFLRVSKLPELKHEEIPLEYNKIISDHYLDPKDKKNYINIVAPVYMRGATVADDLVADLPDTTQAGNDSEIIGYIQIGISQHRIYQDSTQFLLQTLEMAPFVFTLGIVLTLWQTRRIILPIKKLVVATQAISNGNFGKKLKFNTQDELGELASSFNKMSQDLLAYKLEVLSHRETLEDQVVQRTRDLQHKSEEAYELAKKADAANKAKSEFLATMSHEIRTPMNGVLGMTELLLETPLNSRQKRLAKTAFRSAESLLGVINNILDFSKIESGKFQLMLKEFDLRHLLEETAEILSLQVHNKGLELILNLPHDLNMVVKGDPERLRQVLINLMGNAFKFTEQGEIQLKVSWIDQLKPGKTVSLLFEVIDSGPGIAAEQQEFIFESFTQADGSITRRYGGTGLGLTISRKLVELMGGTLKLVSTLGEGSCFYFILSFEHDPLSTIEKADISVLQDLPILVVDDNATNRAILRDQLSHWGGRCDCVESGSQALNRLIEAASMKQPYQLAILDWHMPKMDGLALARTMCIDPLIPRLPIVMLSSDNVLWNVSEDYHQYINCFLSKPVTQQKLLDCLLEVLGVLDRNRKIQRESISGRTFNQPGRKILLAEDNVINQEVGQGIIRALGCQVQVVNNGKEAIEAFGKEHYDLILMDCHMPEMDGFQATAKIREQELAQAVQTHIPIIALTADVQKGIGDRCISAGMDGYISKPFSKQQLQTIFIQWLSSSENRELSGIVADIPDRQLPVEKSQINVIAIDALRNITTETGESLLNRAIELFVNSAAQEISKMRMAFANDDAETLTRIAHSFKSSCANLGADSLADACKTIENLGNERQLNAVEDLLQLMESGLDGVLAELQTNVISISALDYQNPNPSVQITNNRILLIDDDANFRLITGEVLRAARFCVDEAASCTEAIEKTRLNPPDLILLDAIMEGVDGFETCRLLKADPALADVPIIMSTGLGDHESITKAFDAGATDFIVKPLNYPILIHRLHFTLRAGQNTAELKNNKLQLAAAQRIARLGYWTWDTKKNLFSVSEHLATLCDMTLESFNGTLDDFLKLVHVDDRGFVNDIILSAKHNKTLQHREYRLVLPSAEVVFVHQEIEVLTNQNDTIVTGTVQDITHKKQTEKQIHRLAYFDNLTGLASRSYYQERIEDIIKTAARRNEQFAFLFLDLDGFKDINDSFGHNIGDQFLKSIAQRIKLVVRDIDFASRMGGDEFCVILNNITDEDSVAEVAARCLQRINQPLLLDNHQVIPKASIGIALFPRDGIAETELMKAADTAMYAAKQAGKQRYVFYSPDMASQAIDRMKNEQLLRDAFEQGQFMLEYQPQISMITGRMVGVEALVRWRHPENGIVPPNDFIGLAEQLGLIVDLGCWVLQTALDQVVQWRTMGMPDIRLAVNISPYHFKNTSLLNTVRDLLEKNQVSAGMLELEVTESAMQTEGHVDVFRQLRELGVKIAIDDFGTGFSCLASLNQLPLDCLKIDKVFVDDVLYNQHTSLLLGTIIGLANALGYTLIAEGVETKEQALAMHGMGCDIIQGFFFSRPVASEDIPALLDVDFTLQKDIFQFSE